MQDIVFENFSAYYYRKKEKDYLVALDDISLTIRQGEFFVIVGESGCGKSTLLRSILGFIDDTKGNVTIDGINVEKINIKDANLGYIQQELALYPNKTVYQNIAYPLTLMKTPQPEIDRRVKELAQTLGIYHLLTRLPKHLSGGQLQRVAIGRAIIKDPDIVLFDEPFSNLDPLVSKGLVRLIKGLHEKNRTTYVYVTHHLQEAFLLADRIMVMKNGAIEEIGTPDELIKNGRSELIREFVDDE
jgi:multiple sugar transport system ATP-binding protein